MRNALAVPKIKYFFSNYIDVCLTLGSTALTNRLYNVIIQNTRDWKEKFQLLYSWLACSNDIHI